MIKSNPRDFRVIEFPRKRVGDKTVEKPLEYRNIQRYFLSRGGVMAKLRRRRIVRGHLLTGNTGGAAQVPYNRTKQNRLPFWRAGLVIENR